MASDPPRRMIVEGLATALRIGGREVDYLSLAGVRAARLPDPGSPG
ncbi:MAG: hypothetical protein JXA78_08835 [Anaerolineales bacterium]|nr:hypothetical protein [Anaerolineales bacterium]